MKLKKLLAMLMALVMVLGTMSIAVFADGEVASIDGTLYATLAEAVADANVMDGGEDGVTITLLQDTTFNQEMTISKNITIDGAGYTLTRYDDEGTNNDYGGTLFTVENGASLNLNNLTIDGNNDWSLDKDTVIDKFSTLVNIYSAPEADAPKANGDLFKIGENASVSITGSKIKNHYFTSGPHLFNANSGSSLVLNDSDITNCYSYDTPLILLTKAEMTVNDGEISDNAGQGTDHDGNLFCLEGGSTLTLNSALITVNCYGSNGILIGVKGSTSIYSEVIINDSDISGNYANQTLFYLTSYAKLTINTGTICENRSRYAILSCVDNSDYITIYDVDALDNTVKGGALNGIFGSAGNKLLYGGTYSVDVDKYCAPGYIAYPIDENDDREADVYKVIKLMTLEFEDVTPNGTEGEKLYNINLKSTEGDEINRLNAVDLTFAFEKEGGEMAYEIIAPENGEIEINNVDGDRYEFHYKDKDDDVTSDTGAKITIGQVKITGFGKFSFSVDESADTNAAHATELDDNIVDSFIAANGLSNVNIIAGESYMDISNKIEDEILVPLKNLTVNITFPNKVEYNAAVYQDMTLTVTGGMVDKEIKLGDADIDETLDAEIANPATVTVSDDDCSYAISLDLPYNTTYTVTVEGAGYRTAHYSVTLREDAVLNFWNNVKDVAVAIEEGSDITVQHNFLAGDIVEDNNINVYDLSATLSYFATVNVASDYAKYDLNRDGVIDSKDVAYILVSWGN